MSKGAASTWLRGPLRCGVFNRAPLLSFAHGTRRTLTNFLVSPRTHIFSFFHSFTASSGYLAAFL